MPVVTLGDLNRNPARVKQGKIATGVDVGVVRDGDYDADDDEDDDCGGVLLKGRDGELILSGGKKGGKRKQDGDGDYRMEHGDHTDEEDEGEIKTLKKKRRQKLEHSKKGEVGGAARDTLTPGQVVALHWGGQGTGAGADAGGKEWKEDDRANRGGESRELDGGDVKGGTGSSAGPLTGRLRNSKKRDIGRRLGDA